MLAVIVFHAFPETRVAGFIGVDVFFVISGFLISTILYADLDAGTLCLRGFYARRVRRIFPALLVVGAAVLLLGWYALFADEYARLGKHVAAGTLFVSNLALLKESGYFDTASALKPLLHLWSLGVEEQFYLLWPFALLLCRRCNLDFLAVSAAVALASFAVNLHFTGVNPAIAYYSPLSRFWELMIGCMLARLVGSRAPLPRAQAQACSGAGAALLIAGLVCIRDETSFPGWAALLPTCGSFMLIAAGPESFVNRVLLARPVMVRLGLISYPLYLWHWPLLSFAYIVWPAPPPVWLRAAAVALAMILSWLTYRFVQTPLRRRRTGGPRTAGLWVAMGALCAAAIAVYAGQIPPRDRNPYLDPAAQVSGFKYLDLHARRDSDSSYSLPSANRSVTLFLGDSHMAQYAPRIGRLIAAHPDLHSAVFVVGGGCVPIEGVRENAAIHARCSAVLAEGMKLAGEADVKTVVIGSAWSEYFDVETRYPKAQPTDYEYYYLGAGNERHSFRGGGGDRLALQRFENYLEQIARTRKVYLLLDNPVGESLDPHRFLDRHLACAAGPVRAADWTIPAAQLRVREELIDVARQAGVEIIDPSAALCSGPACARVTPEGMPIYADSSHLSAPWVLEHAGYLDRTLAAVAAAKGP